MLSTRITLGRSKKSTQGKSEIRSQRQSFQRTSDTHKDLKSLRSDHSNSPSREAQSPPNAMVIVLSASHRVQKCASTSRRCNFPDAPTEITTTGRCQANYKIPLVSNTPDRTAKLCTDIYSCVVCEFYRAKQRHATSSVATDERDPIGRTNKRTTPLRLNLLEPQARGDQNLKFQQDMG